VNNTFSKLGVQFLVLGITALLQDRNLERYTQFGAVCYPHQTHTKKLRKKLGSQSKFWGSWLPSGCATMVNKDYHQSARVCWTGCGRWLASSSDTLARPTPAAFGQNAAPASAPCTAALRVSFAISDLLSHSRKYRINFSTPHVLIPFYCCHILRCSFVISADVDSMQRWSLYSPRIAARNNIK